ncbi:hypothetical protein GGI09_003504 [Coemansia sp. S100]|nr:hypothetical protein GGI09_003504 [Coemansia sp. S100]KAJ2107747.1 hypothetical protein GGI16_001412 [Coemansia sp. S142-1]
MTRPSSFQTLPILVTELIVDYVAGKETKVPVFNPAEVGTHSAIRRAESETEGRLLRQLPLLWACSSFRAVVFASYCKRCAIRFIGSRHNRRAVTRNNWPGRLKNLDIPVHLLAKELLMEVSLRDIYLGHTLGMLLLQYNIARVFPKVRSLEFQFTLIYSDSDIAANSRRILTNIGSFARYIGQVVPMVRTVSVSLSYISNRVPQTRVPFFGDLVSQLYRLAGHIEYCRNCHTVPVELQPTIISNLTTMDCHVDGNIELLMALVRRNASTLQSLTTRSLMYVDISELVRDPSGGGYVQYTSMCMLKLYHFTNLATSQHAVFDGALPFPMLRSLQVLFDFPFGDDTLFRGNAKTLEYLHLQLDDLSVSVFQRHRVFTPVSHPKLRRVKIQHAKGRKPSTLSTTSDYLRFVLNISSNATVCSFYDVSGVLGLQSELLLFDDHRHIRILDMPNVRFDLWYAFGLIRSLPLLVVLHTLSPTLGQMPKGISLDKLPKYVAATYASIGKSFRCWRFSNSLGRDVKCTAMCVLLLSLIYPRAVVALVHAEPVELLLSEMRLLLVRKAFKDYRSRWEYLLRDNRRKGCVPCKYTFY